MQRMSAEMGFGFLGEVGPIVFLSDSFTGSQAKHWTKPVGSNRSHGLLSDSFTGSQAKQWTKPVGTNRVPWSLSLVQVPTKTADHAPSSGSLEPNQELSRNPKLTHMVSITPMHS
jgi:hypothetical protein